MRPPLAALAAATLLALSGCTAPGAPIGPRVTVAGVGADDFLRLRAGPGLGYSATLGLPDGTALIRRNCQYELGQEWCRVSLAEAPGLTGWVASNYLRTP